MNCAEIWIQCWNIYGVFKNINGYSYNKLQDPDFIATTQKFKIFGLIETQHTSEDIDKLQIPDFKCFQVCRKKKKFGRKHGGIAVFIHKSIIKGISKVPTQGSEAIILKMDKVFFKLNKPTYLIFTYCSPANSSYTLRTNLEPFADLEQKLSNLESESEKILLGDFNARTGAKLDFLPEEDNSLLDLPGDYVTDTVATYQRGNLDSVTNMYGDLLISLCRNAPLRICNGRKLGDVQGSFTCQKWNGQSTVDYCLASPGVYSQILFFKVGQFLPLLSDHCPISIALKSQFYQSQRDKESETYSFIPKPQKLSWDKNIATRFEQFIQTSDSKIFLTNFAKNGILSDQTSIDESTEFLTDFLISAAEKATSSGLFIGYTGGKRSPDRNWKFRKKTNRRIVKPKWYDATCDSLKKDINKTASLLKKYPNNPYLRGRIQSESKKYRKLLKSKQKEHINKLFNELDIMYKVNPRGYMNIVKSLKNGSFDRKISDDLAFIDPNAWREHFSTLLGPTITPTPSDQLMSDYIEQNCDKFESELGIDFTRSELLEAISSLTNNKATSFDRISNEILKTAKLVIAGPTLKLFNKILDSSIYPSQWKYDILTPIHKSGGKDDPNNFRGVAVSSCFGKLFNKMLQKRLEKICHSKNAISDVQGSSKAGSRTSDHLLIVKFLIDKYVKQKGKHLFTCFVDLRKAFDTVPRTQMFYSLLYNYGIGGKFLKILQEMYKNNQIFVKLSSGLLQPFTTSISVKQGCVFSPILFNLYIDKIADIFDKSCSPVKIKNADLNCLLWADDLLLVSETATGLQNCLDKTQNFYDKLGLEINLKKTKIIVFNKRGTTLENKFNFYLKGTKLEITDQYQYLGLKLRPSGSFKTGVDELNDKASRAWFGISNTIYRNKRMEHEKVFSIFDSIITPIALYASCVWLPFNIRKSAFESPDKLLEAWGPLKAETLNQKCSKMILSVHTKASRLAVLGELGRYPIFISALSQCINYKLSLFSRKTPTNLIGNVLTEMMEMNNKGIDCWLTRVINIEKSLKIPTNMKCNKLSGKKITTILRGKFDSFWLKKLTSSKKMTQTTKITIN